MQGSDNASIQIYADGKCAVRLEPTIVEYMTLTELADFVAPAQRRLPIQMTPSAFRQFMQAVDK